MNDDGLRSKDEINTTREGSYFGDSPSHAQKQDTSPNEKCGSTKNDDDGSTRPAGADVLSSTRLAELQQGSSTRQEKIDEENEEAMENGDNCTTGMASRDEQNEQRLPSTEGAVGARKKQQDDAANEGPKADGGGGIASMDPMKIIRKGAVAAVGGTMVGVGLIMIPLPTPFGAVIASSGMVVLGTEFEGAKEMHERIIVMSKETVKNAKAHIVRTIESMEQDELDSMSSIDQDSQTSMDPVNSRDENAADIPPHTEAPIPQGQEDDVDLTAGMSDTGSGTVTPSWLHMNPVERKRQERLAIEKSRSENQTAFEQTKQYLTKSAVTFLSKNVLPLLKTDDVTPNDDENLEGNGDHNEGNCSDDVSKNASVNQIEVDGKGGHIMVPHHN